MARIFTGTVSVTANSKNVTAWVGDNGVTLSNITAPIGSQIVIDGFANFIEARPTTTTLTLVLPHKGTTGTGKAAAISAMTSEEISIGTLTERTAQVIQDLSVLDANGRGLFYNFITPTGANDPGPGKIAMNSSNPSGVTEVYIDPLDANDVNRDVSGIIDLWSSGTVLILRSIATTAYVAFKLAGPAQLVSGYYKLSGTYVDHDGVLAAEPIAVEYRLAGLDKDADAYVNNLTDRDAYNTQPAGFRVKVSDIGDGRAAVYAKRSATSGDWTQPAIVTGAQSIVPGPTGPAPNLTIGTVSSTTGAPSATITGTNPDYQVSFVLKQGDVGPQGTSFNPDARGLFSARSTYNSQAAGFAFLATDQGNLYFRQGASGNWSAAVPLTGPAGASGTTITTTNITGNGTAGPYALNAAPTGLDSVIEATITGVEQYDYTITGTAPNYSVTFGQVIPTGVLARVRTAGPLSVGTAAAVANGIIDSAAITASLAEQAAILTKIGGRNSSQVDAAVTSGVANRLRFDTAQTLTTAQKTQGQSNLGVPWEKIGDVVNLAGLNTYIWTGLGSYRKLRVTSFYVPNATSPGDGAFLRVGDDTNIYSSYFGMLDFRYNGDTGVRSEQATTDTLSAFIRTDVSATYGGSFVSEIDDFNKNELSYTKTQIREHSNGSAFGWGTRQHYCSTVAAFTRLQIRTFNNGNFNRGYVLLEGVRG